MAKKFVTVHSNGFKEESSHAYEANNFRFYGDESQKFFISGKEVTSGDFFEIVKSNLVSAFDKKNQTHKRVKVLHGSSGACYVEKWVKR
jgi:hypothetical protein